MTWFELGLMGGPVGRRLARRRAAAGEFDWAAITATGGTDDARLVWTRSAFAEYATAAAFAELAGVLLAAGAPIDFSAAAADFALDEILHCELCAKVASAFGGGVPLEVDLQRLVRPSLAPTPLLRAAERVVRTCCVGEAASVEVIRASANASRPSEISKILDVLARDEAEHAAFGWEFLDWAEPALTHDDRAELARVAQTAIDSLAPLLAGECASDGPRGVLSCAAFDPVLADALERRVRAPLRVRNILV